MFLPKDGHKSASESDDNFEMSYLLTARSLDNFLDLILNPVKGNSSKKHQVYE